MSSFDDRAIVDGVIAANGGSDGYTHIIEYQNHVRRSNRLEAVQG
jgi:hypothetical protein